MIINFYKYQGTGNDFIIIDNFNNGEIFINKKIIQKLCSQKFGIGADGLMILTNHELYDFEMKYFNSDGSGGTMCGNGGRCITAFAKYKKYIDNRTKFIASDGIHEAFISDKNTVKLKMTDVEEIKTIDNYFYCNTGSPHHIEFVNNIEKHKVFEEGRKIRYSSNYSNSGTNVNFVQVIKKDKLFVRTYERGVEAETLSCGTGAVASALTYAKKHNFETGKIFVKTKGGILYIYFKKSKTGFSEIWLEGIAELVFKGQIEIDS